ncbi:hypothetical protein MLD38_028856 [Melastoma candidum]|uniref:Uncharacterized protein n=1 Tax=Melastoma candidum TaxID=119954 RepID=A0ACB9N4G7_9MYRT|nr:hypothetical protein MLD38_028856 [Melastoma candidum]
MGGTSRLLLVLLSTPLPPRRHALLLLSHHHRRRLSSLPLSFRRTSTPQLLSPISSRRRLGSLPADSTLSLSEDSFPENLPSFPGPSPELAPEWNNFLSYLSSGGYFDGKGRGAYLAPEDELAEGVASSEELVRGISACLAFARDWPFLLRQLDKRDVEVLIRSASPDLFKSGEVSSRRMSLFLSDEDTAVANSDASQTVDLMKYILSSTILARAGLSDQELSTSVWNLLAQMVKLSCSTPVSSYADNANIQYPGGYGISQRPRGQNIEMKRGDWICPRCNFMNFARNIKCLECEEARPKRQLTGDEWECPQCDFFNYGKNISCLRCDCKRPGGVPTPLQSRLSASLGTRDNANLSKIERKLAVNDKKAQRWFNKTSKLDSPSEMQKAIEDEDFPEIMPLGKGVNRFVVGTRKITTEGIVEKSQLSSSSSGNKQNSSESTINEILESAAGQKSIGGSTRGKSVAYVPFVPLPADMFAKRPETAENSVANNDKSIFWNSSEQPSVSSGSKATDESAVGSPLHGLGAAQNGGYGTAKGEEESSRWLNRISDLNNAQYPRSSSVSSENFPETMPIQKGKNRFVVDRMKDRPTSSPLYKRRATMEQTGSTNFVPFVPFPPGYFAKKDNQRPEGDDSSTTASSSGGNSETTSAVVFSGKEDDVSSWSNGSNVQRMDSPVQHGPSINDKAASVETPTQGILKFSNTGSHMRNVGSNWDTSKNEGTSTSNISDKTSEGVKARERWTGNSLEGSLVTEGPDPLDMSEEAKAERWFRRVAQIKDISELSQIPDEDFPSIMPMRKGVNRFVVSKRKTPLERRLTSAQYRRNLPVVRSDPVRPQDDES